MPVWFSTTILSLHEFYLVGGDLRFSGFGTIKCCKNTNLHWNLRYPVTQQQWDRRHKTLQVLIHVRTNKVRWLMLHLKGYDAVRINFVTYSKTFTVQLIFSFSAKLHCHFNSSNPWNCRMPPVQCCTAGVILAESSESKFRINSWGDTVV